MNRLEANILNQYSPNGFNLLLFDLNATLGVMAELSVF
jgi:hypothetical protein